MYSMQCKRILGIALSAILALGCAQAWATDHVLVMTISEYPRSPLQGVKHDAGNALLLAGKLGYNTSNATVLKDQQLTAVGMRTAFANLLSQVKQNDRVFIYYSGHGYSMAQGGTCIQGLVSQDELPIPTAELSNQLDGIKSIVSDALVIFDACHSGGNRDIAVTRSFDSNADSSVELLKAKVWTPRGGERCETPVNELAKSWQPSDEQYVTRSAVFPKSNFTFIAAANEREVALDDKNKGGLATLALLQCASDGVPSASGLVTAQDLAHCAQQHVAESVQAINTQLSRKEYLPHQLAVYGNRDKIFDVKPLHSAVILAQNAPVAMSKAEAVLAGFQKFAANSNGNWGLRVEPSETTVPIGQAIRFKYQTNQTGYVQVLYVGSDRKEMNRVWPAEGQTRLLGSTEGQLPISLTVTAPAGDNTFLIVVSQTPLNLSSILQDGSALVNAQTMQQLGCELIKQRNVLVKEDSPRVGTCNSLEGTEKGSAALPAGDIGGYTARLFTVRGL